MQRYHQVDRRRRDGQLVQSAVRAMRRRRFILWDFRAHETAPVVSLVRIDGVAHGFFGRQGGVSEGIYASLNCGYGSGDDAARVRENRTRVATWLGTGEDRS